MKYSQEDIDLVKSKASIDEVVGSFVALKKQGADLVSCCPFHKDKTPSFHVSVPKQMFKCFGCNKSGDAIAFLMEHEQFSYINAIEWLANKYNIPLEKVSATYAVPIFKNNTTLSDSIIKWFESRKISQKTLLKMKITEGVEYMPQLEKEVNTIQFNYFRDGELVNTKYRGSKKSFKLYKNAELIFYNIDSIKGKKEVIITEGEADTLALIEASYDQDFGIISVPNGAHASNNNLIYIDNCIDLFAGVEKIHIATDNDLAGRFLREQLATRFGKDKCDYIEFKECKDANECLMKYGIQGILESCSAPINFPLEGVFNVSDFTWEVADMYTNGLPKGVSIKLHDFAMRFVKGYITTITGIPNMGKSTFVDEICLRLLIHHDWRGAFYSPENKPTQLHISKMASKLSGKPWDGENRMSKEEVNEAVSFLDKKVFFIKPEKDFSIQSILAQVKSTQERHGLDYFVIDAWNKLEHKGGNDIGYIGKTLDYLAIFCEANNLHCFLVAHPTKMEKDKKIGKYLVPTLYNISGSADFFNKSDNGISVYVDWDTKKTSIYRQKVKFGHWGWIGHSEYSFDEKNFRYYRDGYPETLNWITKRPIATSIAPTLFNSEQSVITIGGEEPAPF